MKQTKKALLIALWIFLPAVSTVCADNHGLLIGINAYPHITPSEQLVGPVNDVMYLEKLLTQTFEFPSANITTLTDQRATKANILKALNDLKSSTKPGDFIFIYFSGHGTSFYAGKEWKIDPYTGALLPSDFRFDDNDISKTLERVIIGKKDIRPVLEKLDKDRQVLAVFDACFSGDTIRDLKSCGKPKYVELEDLSDPSLEVSDDYNKHKIEKPPYPYNNVIYISASSKLEVARDITSEDIRLGKKTVDGLPHGALTNSLLFAFQGRGDTNNDKKVTYNEVYQYVKSDVKKNFNHTPQLLYSEKNKSVLDQPIFKKDVPGKPVSGPEEKLFRIRLEKGANNLGKNISGIPGVILAEKRYHILIREEGGMYVLYLSNDSILTEIPKQKPDEVVERIRRWARLRDLTGISFPDQTFNVFLDLTDSKGVLVENDAIGFRIRTEADAHILLINIDPKGYISIIYPYNKTELEPVKAGKELKLPNIGRVLPPNFGTEYLILFGFRNRPPGLEKLTGAEFPPSDPRFLKLINMIDRARKYAAQTIIQVNTCSKEDIRTTNQW